MLDDWQFWAIAAAVVIGSLAVVFAPLLRGAGRAERRAGHDMQVYRDQLREIEADTARGVLGADEAAASRAEIGRRLLAAADAAEAGAAAGVAPRALSRWAAPVLVAVLAAAAFWLYAALGAGGLRDLPLAERRPDQATAEAMVADALGPPPAIPEEERVLIERLQGALAGRPGDLEGHRLLARSLGSLGRWPEARAAQARVVAIAGDAAAAPDLVALTELMVLAAGGYVSPDAEAALGRARALAPADPLVRFYSALALAQNGRRDLAARIWAELRAEGPADAPWMPAVEAQLAELGPPPGAAPGPSAADIDAAAGMAEGDRQAMVEGMVAGLAGRLATEGGPPADWARLIRALGVLGRGDEAAAIRAEAAEVFAGDAAALAAIAAAARDAGLAE